MTIKLIGEFKHVIFRWSNDLSECSMTALNVSDDEVNAIIEAEGHEGKAIEGWKTEIS